MLRYLILIVLVSGCLTQPDDIAGVIRKLEALQKTVEKQQHEIEAQKKAMNARFISIEENLKHVTSAIVDTLFLATISAETIAISDDEPIIFDTTPINPGGHYNPVLGAYTAPFNGYYQFSVGKRSNNEQAHFWLLIDEERYLYCDLYSSGAVPTGTATINIELTAAQIVRVENDRSAVIYGTNSAGSIESWFTGYMLYEL